MMVAIGENNRRIGEDHPRAKMTNRDIELLLELRDEGWSYGQLARKFETTKSYVGEICRGRKRCQYPVRFKKIKH